VEFYLLCCWNIARAFVFLEPYQFACLFFVGVRIDQFHRVSSALHLIARPLKPPPLHSLYSLWMHLDLSTASSYCFVRPLIVFHRNNRQTIKTIVILRFLLFINSL
jgi:hypothetical protein